MANIIEDKDDLYIFYKDYFKKNCNLPKKEVFNDFQLVIRSKFALMPYFFVQELIKRGYDVEDEETHF